MSEIIDEYLTIESPSEGFYKDKGSKFYAFAHPAETEEEFGEIMKELKKKYYDARHHVYAFRFGPDKKHFRASDDGEPGNSSGPPVLGQIRSHDLTNIVIIVVRYFGGTKLGVPGLINAYKTAAEDAIQNAKIITKTVDAKLQIGFEYPLMNDVMRIIKEEELNVVEQDFQLSCSVIVSMRKGEIERVAERFKKFYELKVKEL